MPDRQANRELAIFQAFAKTAGMATGAAHWEKRDPPEPDILYHAEGAEPVAFEMVEIIDEEFAGRVWSQLKLKSRFEHSFLALPPDRKTRIEERVGDALVHVVFEPGATLKAKQNSIDLVLHWLGDLDRAFAGECRKVAGQSFPPAVSSVRIARLNLSGPCFDVEAVGSLSNPAVDAVRGKWAKSYTTKHQIQLLAYYELQPEGHEAMWLPDLRAFLAEQSSSPFRRVWVYDCATAAVRFASGQLE